MSDDEHGDDHGHDADAHQAPWVFFVTVGACVGFLMLLMFGKWMAGTL
ncbi:MAG: hypothetical protein ABEL76_13315 [Bradymonadaceae bacterium]